MRLEHWIIVSFVALCAGMTGVFLAGNWSPAPEVQRASSLHDLIHKDLELSDAQEQRLAVIERKFAARKKELAAARLGEGERLAAVVEEHISEIEGLTSQVAALAKLQPERCKARLTEQLEAQTRATSTKQRAGDAAPPSGEPRRALLRVMDGNASWVLVEYEDDDEVHWRYFEDEVELQDHVRRDSGEPLQLPHPCLTPNQSAKIQEEARKAVADITEDFRRFRVKAEISRKQKDAQMKQVAASSMAAAYASRTSPT